MRRLGKYNTDGKIIDTFNGMEVNENNEVSFEYDQRFILPQVSIFHDKTGEIDRVNFQVKKISDYSMTIRFMEKLKNDFYTVKIF